MITFPIYIIRIWCALWKLTDVKSNACGVGDHCDWFLFYEEQAWIFIFKLPTVDKLSEIIEMSNYNPAKYSCDHLSPQVGLNTNVRASGLPGSGSYQTHGLAYGNTSAIPQPGPNNNRVVSSSFVPSGQVVQQNLLSSGSYNPTVPENRATYVAHCNNSLT